MIYFKTNLNSFCNGRYVWEVRTWLVFVELQKQPNSSNNFERRGHADCQWSSTKAWVGCRSPWLRDLGAASHLSSVMVDCRLYNQRIAETPSDICRDWRINVSRLGKFRTSDIQTVQNPHFCISSHGDSQDTSISSLQIGTVALHNIIGGGVFTSTGGPVRHRQRWQFRWD